MDWKIVVFEAIFYFYFGILTTNVKINPIRVDFGPVRLSVTNLDQIKFLILADCRLFPYLSEKVISCFKILYTLEDIPSQS